MSRYLLIDTEQEGQVMGLGFQSEFEIDGKILTEKETMIKFREIYSAGKIFSLDHEEKMWDAMKKSL